MTEPTKIFLGVVTLPDENEVVAFNFPADLDPEAIRVELERVEAKRAADAHAESAKLRKMFLPPADEAEKGDKEDKPRDE
jgi:hypothetical protein